MDRIVKESCRSIRKIAAKAVGRHMFEIILFGLVSQFIIQGPALILGFMPAKLQTGFFATIVNFYAIFINGPISLSLCHYFGMMFRGETNKGLGEISFGFDNISRALMLYIRIRIFTWLWSMLFFFPGIIASIRYSQSFFILAENPDYSAATCMDQSSYMMMGNKLKYTLLILNYAPIYIICTLPAMYAYITLNASDLAAAQSFMLKYDMQNAIISATTVSPYVNLLLVLTAIATAIAGPARAVFYDLLTDKLIIRSYTDYTPHNFEEKPVQPSENIVIDTEYKVIENEDSKEGSDENLH